MSGETLKSGKSGESGESAESARAIRDAFARGEVAAEAVVGTALERISSLDPAIGAFLDVDRDGALERARGLDTARRSGAAPGILAGVPIALKDVVCQRGRVATAGSRILEGWKAPYDASIIERLEAEGAVIVGKTNLDEFAMGSSCEHSAYFPTRNPWARDRVPGGSSGGSAAAVAAGMVPVSIGSDTGGSIRQPAALCGVVGFKPTYGRVSRYGLIAFASSLDQLGPFARSVEDAALVYRAIAGRDRRDATSLGAEVVAPDLQRDVRGLRIGVHPDYVGAIRHGGVRAAVEATLARLAADGATLVRLDDVDLMTASALPIYYLIATSEASSNLARFDGMRFGPREPAADLAASYAATRSRRFGAEVKRRILLGTFALSAGYRDAYYRRAQQARVALRSAFARAFLRADVLVGAVAPEPAFRLGEIGDPLTMYLCDTLTVPASLAGLPAISVPAAASAEGLPIGVQVIGPPEADARVLEVAAAIERSTGWRGKIAPSPEAAA